MNRGEAICEELVKHGVRYVCTVPDSEVHFLHVALEAHDGIEVIQTCSEGETIGIVSGLGLAGERGAVLIEDQGLFDSGNMLKWAVGAKLPLVLMIGYIGLKAGFPYAVPFLNAFDVPSFLLDEDDKVGLISEAFAEADRRGGVTAVLMTSADGFVPGTADGQGIFAKGGAR